MLVFSWETRRFATWTCLCLIRFVVFGTSEAADHSATDDELLNANSAFFVSEIFNKYGDNKSITYEGFEHLLENLGLGKLKFETTHDVSVHKVNGTFLEFHDRLLLHRHDHGGTLKPANESHPVKKRNLMPDDERETRTRVAQVIGGKCLTPQDILVAFELRPDHEAIISPAKYLQICPAIIYELDQKLCQTHDDEEEASQLTEEPDEYHLVWIYASISILVMGLSGILCILLVPIVKNDSDTWLVQFLVSLAAGTLCGDALIHLLPQVYSGFDGEVPHSAGHSDMASIFKGATCLLAILMFFLVENLLKEIKPKKKKKFQMANELNAMLERGEEAMNQVRPGHHHNHGNDGIKSVAWMAIMGDVLHNVTDGLSIGAAFTSRLSAGFASSIAIFCHELPHELGDYAILLASGMSVKKSLFYNVLSSVFSLIGMVVGVLLGEYENASLWINAFTAGSFLYIALTDLLPEMKLMAARSNFKNFIVQIIGVSCGAVLMLTIALYEDEIESILR